jgi:glycosyltransferase involved in cell wall biosynthesis
MRVCHFVSGDVWAGAEVQVATLLRALKALPGLELSAIVLNYGRLHDELAQLGIPVAVCDESRMGFARLFLAARSRLMEFRPEILHTHGYKENVLGAAAGRASCRPRLVQTWHGILENLPGWAGLKMSVYDRINVAVGRTAADAIIGVSSEIARVLQQRHSSTDVRCIRNGIDTARVVPALGRTAMRDRLAIAHDSLVVGSVGRLMPIKGFGHLIEAFAQLRGRRAAPGARLMIVGDGPLRSELEQCAERLGVSGDVSFLGARDDVYDLMSAFDVFALPSLHEGIPMVILEAMAVGVPIVASRVGGIPEILEDGRDALLVPAGDAGALAKGIETLASSPTLRAATVRAAREQVEAQFSIRVSAASTRDLYRSLIERAGR